MFLISDLCDLIESYLDSDEVRGVYDAYLFGAEAHQGQHRLTGEPYIYHPIAVARILAEMRMDHQTITAAILHDVIEDTPTAKAQLRKRFGKEVAELVDGVSKLTQIEFESHAERQAENFRKMLMAMARDIRVIIVKLADRLHNMRTLGALAPDKRRAIARETLEIYAPIAQRLGMNAIRLELEELGFAACYPMRYRVLSEEVKKARGHRKEVISKIETAIKRRVRQAGLHAEVIAREKHLYSVYQKMVRRRLSFSDVFDVYAVRIITGSADECYRALGVMHNLYKPVPGKFKDYIAIPKANGYQSLHTVLFGPYGVPIELQIRTREMNEVAEVGIAAHWLYKSGEETAGRAQKRAREWLRGILELQKNAGNSVEFLENVKIDLFPDEVYVFSPEGDIFELPHGATVVDFAYAVHSDIGDRCLAARIDRRLAPLRTRLSNGQTVEIITSDSAVPNPSWLSFVVTAKARARIRHHLKTLQRDEAVKLGRRMLNRELAPYLLAIENLKTRDTGQLLKEFGLDSMDDLFAEIALGTRLAPLVARRLAPPGQEDLPDPLHEPGPGERRRPLVIKGTEGLLVSFPKCCRPIPGDPVVGFVTAGRGLVIHHQACKNAAELRNQPEKWIDVEWGDDIDREFDVGIRVVVANQPGVLATVAAAISDAGANIVHVETDDIEGLSSIMSFVISVRDRNHLAGVIRRLRAIRSVSRLSRVTA